MKISMGYPEKEEELAILRRSADAAPANLSAVISLEEIVVLKEKVEHIHISPRLEEYIVNLAEATRDSEYIRLGVSPRGSLALHRTARAYAVLCGRDYVLPDDIKFLAPFVLTHRIIISPKGKSVLGSPEEVLAQLLRTLTVPTE